MSEYLNHFKSEKYDKYKQKQSDMPFFKNKSKSPQHKALNRIMKEEVRSSSPKGRIDKKEGKSIGKAIRHALKD